MSNKSNIGYAGDITVTARAGTKLIETRKYHNNGKTPLFKFLVECLQGAYSAAELNRPLKIKVFNNSATSVAFAEEHPFGNNTSVGTKTTCSCGSSTFIMIDQVPEISSNVENNYAEIKFSFIIPYVHISLAEINQVCLYGASEMNNENPSAIFFFADEEEPDKFDPIKVGSNRISYNLTIEWTLRLSNNA